MSTFADLMKDAKPNQTGIYIQPGAKYRLEVQNISTNNGYKGLHFVAEFKVKEVTQLDPNAKPNPVDQIVSTVISLNPTTKAGKMGPGNVMALAMALLNCDEKTAKSKLTGLISDSQPARFFPIDVEAFQKPGKDFTHLKWQHVAVTPEEEEAILARQKANPVAKAA